MLVKIDLQVIFSRVISLIPEDLHLFYGCNFI